MPCTFGAFDRLLRGICRQSPLAGIVFGIEKQYAVVIPEIGEIAVAVEERTGRQQQHLRLNRPVDRLGDASQLGLPVGYHGGQAGLHSSSRPTIYFTQSSNGWRFTCTASGDADTGRFLSTIGIGPYVRSR